MWYYCDQGRMGECGIPAGDKSSILEVVAVAVAVAAAVYRAIIKLTQAEY
jgi:hypothetical protein